MEKGPQPSPENSEPRPLDLSRQSPIERLKVLLRLGHEHDDDDDDEESLDGTPPKKRRVRKFIGRLLANKEVKTTTVAGEPGGVNRLDSPVLAKLVNVEPAPAEAAGSSLIDSLPADTTNSELLDQAKATAAHVESQNTTLPMQESAAPGPVDETIRAESTAPAAKPTAKQELPLAPAELTIPLHNSAESFTASGPQTTEVVKERIVEHAGGAPIVTLVAAEVLSRHRDKKLRQTDAAQAKQIAELTANQKKIVEAQTHQQSKLPEAPNSAPVPTGEAKAGSVVKPIEGPLASSRHFEQAPSKLPKPTSELQPERTPQSLGEILKTPHFEEVNKVRPNKELANLIETTPGKIFEEVENAAKTNRAIEAEFEHRHEARDEPKQTADTTSGGGAMSVGHPADSGLKPIVPSQAAPVDTEGSAWQRLDPQYRQAAVSGFWTALVIIAVIIIIAVLR